MARIDIIFRMNSLFLCQNLLHNLQWVSLVFAVKIF